ncbi:hypothetical protein ACFLYP_04460, partial [Chloroflexota bacterium]
DLPSEADFLKQELPPKVFGRLQGWVMFIEPDDGVIVVLIENNSAPGLPYQIYLSVVEDGDGGLLVDGWNVQLSTESAAEINENMIAFLEAANSGDYQAVQSLVHPQFLIEDMKISIAPGMIVEYQIFDYAILLPWKGFGFQPSLRVDIQTTSRNNYSWAFMWTYVDGKWVLDWYWPCQSERFGSLCP